jgi:tetratricopeptide (TPR) repeat protein
MSALTIAFAVAMAFFLVIGAVAVGITEFVGGGNNQQIAQDDFAQTVPDQTESEEENLRQRIEEDPEDYSAHAQLAVLLGNTGRVDEAINHYETALQGDPDDTALRLSFARMLEQRGYDLDAEIQFERVLEAESDNVEAMYMLAEIKERSQPPRQEEADELFEQVIETAPESFYAEMAQERLAESGPDEDPDGTETDPGDDDEPDAD